MAPKVDVYRYRRTERTPETKSWPLDDGQPAFELSLRAANQADAAAAAEAAERLIDDFITGETRGQVAPFFDQKVKLSRGLFYNAATIAEMQAEPVYNATELVVFFDKRPDIYEEVERWSLELNARRKKSLEGSPPVRSETCSEP
jgi:hypothetical protein